jgi:hypothetical protein
MNIFSESQGRTVRQASENCVVLDDYSVKCWGRNNRGEPGLDGMRGLLPGGMGDNLPALSLGKVSVKSVSAKVIMLAHLA